MSQETSPAKVMNRWWVVVGAILVQLCLGAIYAWSAFTGPLTAQPWDLPSIYGPAALGMAVQEHKVLKMELLGPKAELKKLSETAPRLAAGSTERLVAEVRMTELKAQMTTAIDARIDSARVRQLAFGMNKTKTQWIFGVGLATFAIVMALIAGPWQKKAGPRTVATAGGLILGLGYLLAGFSGTSFWGILIGIGILGGAGIGLGYVCPIAALVKWFPDKKGLITGLAVAGFGFGALLWMKLTDGFDFKLIDLIPTWNGFYDMAGWDVNRVFLVYGVLFAVCVGLGALLLSNPPDGWKPAGWTPPSGTAAAGMQSFSPREMVGTVQYWIIFLTFVAGAMAGLMVIGIIGLFGKDQLAAANVDAAKITIITGTAWGLFGSLFNGLGRIAWGSFSDTLGRKRAIVLMTALQGVCMIAFYYIGNKEWGLYVGAALIGFNFGGNFALFPAITADYFGNKNVGVNYPLVFLAYAVGGIVGPLLGGIMGDGKIWKWAFIPAGIVCLVMAVAALTLKPPQVKEAVAAPAEPKTA